MTHHQHVHPHPTTIRLPKSPGKTSTLYLESSPSSSYSTNSSLLSSLSTHQINYSSSSSSVDTHHCFVSKQPHHQNPTTSTSRTTTCCLVKACCAGWSCLKFGCRNSMAFMATHAADVPVHVPSSVRGKKTLDGQQIIKEDLEREVSMLHQMLNHEEKVHEILEEAIRRRGGSTLHIPSFLPPKAKGLLAELVMVEDEIVRLEKEKNNIRQSLSSEQVVSNESKTKQWQLPSRSNISEQFSKPNPKPEPTFQGMHERVPFEPKALYFISKAIKGDHSTLHNFMSNEKKESPIDQKENHGHKEVRFDDKVVKFDDKVSRKSGLQKPPSPKFPPKLSASMQMESALDTSFDSPTKSTSNSSTPSQENSQKSQPNKLSESIMKCLIFIFVRLMRTTRAHEIEKYSSTVTRSPHSALSSRSFRVDAGPNSKANLSLQRDSKQQDPYGVFDIEDSVPRDIGPYKNLVRFTSSSLDPKSINSSSSIPLLRKLRALLNDLQSVDLRLLTHQQKLAFWINMYNACIMHGFLQYGVPSSPENLLALMNKATLRIGGNQINALTIEHFILRQSSSSNLKDVNWKDEVLDREALPQNIYGLESQEPNVTFALCFGTRSSPAVKIYTANGITAELEKSKLEYLLASIVVTSTRRLAIPELLFQNMHNFAHDVNSLVEWICQQLPTSWSLRKSMVECFRAHNNGKISIIVDKMPYDYEFQYLLPV